MPTESTGTPDYNTALAKARKVGASRANDAGLMALFCAGPLQILVGAVGPQLVWEGAQRRGLTSQQLIDLCQDPLKVSDLQW